MIFNKYVSSLPYYLFLITLCLFNQSWAISPTPTLSVQQQNLNTPNKLIPPKEPTPITDDPKQILARINDHPITVADIKNILKTLPLEIQSLPKEMIYPQIIRQIAFDQALLTQIKQEHLDQDPKVKQDIEEAIQNLIKDKLVKAYFLQKISPLLTTASIQAFYDKYYLHQPSIPEIHLKQIILQTKAIADIVLNELKNGKSFEEVARIYSIDLYNRDQQKADIGWFTNKELEPNIAKVVFALPNNAYTKTPIPMNHGWIIIKKIGQRYRPAPSLSEVTPQIKEQITAETINKLYEDSLKKSLFITY